MRMQLKERFIQLIEELRKKEFYATRHVDIVYKDTVYKLVISAMEFGQRVELTGKDEEYMVFVYGIEGLQENGVLHKKNEQQLVKIVRRFTDEILAEMIHASEDEVKEPFIGPQIARRVYIPRTLERPNKKERKNEIVNRLLDRYNHYLFLYDLFGQKDTKYKRKADKLMRLLKRTKTTNKKNFEENG